MQAGDRDGVYTGPVRTCVGCGLQANRAELIRMVATQGSAHVDLSRSLPGRGAWIHPNLSCIKRARQRKTFMQRLRLQRDIHESVWQELDEAAHKMAHGALSS
nr:MULTISPECIES: YlxR family protein [unclassified Schaalia]